jgi:hypothetical protein
MKNKNIIELLPKMEDHRIERKKEHLLTDIIVITMSAVICGAEKWNQIELFGKS